MEHDEDLRFEMLQEQRGYSVDVEVILHDLHEAADINAQNFKPLDY